jgi:hypothetical protein
MMPAVLKPAVVGRVDHGAVWQVPSAYFQLGVDVAIIVEATRQRSWSVRHSSEVVMVESLTYSVSEAAG